MYLLQKFGTLSIHHSPQWQDHLIQYIYFTHRCNIVHWPPTDGQSRKITQVVLIPTQWCLVPSMLLHFFPPHLKQVVIWQYYHKYARRWSIQHNKWKSHAHCRQPGTEGNLFGCLGSMSPSVGPKQHATSSQHCHYYKPAFGALF